MTDQQVIMHGVLTAAGKDDSAHDGYDVLTFKHGSFRVVHPDAQATFVPVVDNKTCYATFTEKGTFTLSHGKGSYVNIKGSGRYTASGKALLKRTKSGACDLNSEPKAELFTVHAAGKLT